MNFFDENIFFLIKFWSTFVDQKIFFDVNFYLQHFFQWFKFSNMRLFFVKRSSWISKKKLLNFWTKSLEFQTKSLEFRKRSSCWISKKKKYFEFRKKSLLNFEKKNLEFRTKFLEFRKRSFWVRNIWIFQMIFLKILNYITTI